MIPFLNRSLKLTGLLTSGNVFLWVKDIACVIRQGTPASLEMMQEFFACSTPVIWITGRTKKTWISITLVLESFSAGEICASTFTSPVQRNPPSPEEHWSPTKFGMRDLDYNALLLLTFKII